VAQSFEIELKNYRCFADVHPARITLKNGPNFVALIGPNNAGKSSLLRAFFELRPIFALTIDKLRDAVKAPLAIDFAQTGVRDVDDLFCDKTDRNLSMSILAIPTPPPGDGPVVPARIQFTVDRTTHLLSFSLSSGDSPAQFNGIEAQGTELVWNGRTSRVSAQLSPYLEMMKALSRAMFIGAFRNILNIGGQERYYDIAVGQSFVRQWRELQTGNSKANNEATFKLVDSIRRVFSFDRLEIFPTADDQTLQLNINGRSYRLNDIGTGIAQFIIVLANAAVRKPSFILIDEPESNLHPVLQLDFLTTLASFASRGMIFSTHSMGLARGAADRIYTARMRDDYTSAVAPLEATTNLAELLGELSYSGYVALGYRKILLVEGTTEVRCFQQLLRLYKKDHQTVILPLGGSSLIRSEIELELGELLRISTDITAIIDSELSSPEDKLSEDRVEFVAICEKLGIKHHVLHRRATENYFTNRAVQAVKGPKYRALSSHELLKDLPQPWSKSENWRIARDMTLSELESTDLGDILESL
jgi:ABC-type branched-subunit amino acid transport system ATPase component